MEKCGCGVYHMHNSVDEFLQALANATLTNTEDYGDALHPLWKEEAEDWVKHRVWERSR